MTKKQYIKKMKEQGFKSQGFLGYWTLPGTSTSISDLNAGDNYQNKYNYMTKQLNSHKSELQG